MAYSYERKRPGQKDNYTNKRLFEERDGENLFEFSKRIRQAKSWKQKVGLSEKEYIFLEQALKLGHSEFPKKNCIEELSVILNVSITITDEVLQSGIKKLVSAYIEARPLATH